MITAFSSSFPQKFYLPYPFPEQVEKEKNCMPSNSTVTMGIDIERMAFNLVMFRKSSQNTNIPNQFYFHRKSNSILFLGKDASNPNSSSIELYRVPLLSDNASSSSPIPICDWELVSGNFIDSMISDTTRLDPMVGKVFKKLEQLSKEEELLRERKRITGTGISTFIPEKATDDASTADRVAIPHKGSVYIGDLIGLAESSSKKKTATASNMAAATVEIDITNPQRSSTSAPRSDQDKRAHYQHDQNLSPNDIDPMKVDQQAALTQPPFYLLGSQIKRRPELLANKVSTGAAMMDIKWSPDGTMMSFVRKSDLWVMDIITGVERRLTFDAKYSKVPSGDFDYEKTCGVAEYIIQEEFDRYTGYWWCDKKDVDGSFKILYLEVDHSGVPLLSIPDISMEAATEVYRYPRVGEANAISEPRIIKVPPPPAYNSNSDTYAKDIERWSLDKASPYKHSKTLRSIFPWCEYVVNANWVRFLDTSVSAKKNDTKPQADFFWLYLLNRSQTKNAIVLFDANDMDHFHVIHEEEREKYWINTNGSIYFFSNEDSSCVDFIILSEKSGFNHLYYEKYSLDSQRLESSIPITSGLWQVQKVLSIDIERSLIYFTGTKDTPLENNIYVATINGSSKDITRLSTPGFNYTDVVMDKSSSTLVCNFSSLKDPSKTMVYKVICEKNLRDASLEVHLKPHQIINAPAICREFIPDWPIVPPTLFSVSVKNEENESISLAGCMFLPQGKGPFPALFAVYGGPHVQLVTNDYKVTNQYKHQMLASLGYAVILLDGRGSFNRGLAFEGALYKHMGEVELNDQIAGVKYLTSEGIIDPGRVAISGWSYGGYLSLMALCKRSDVFKIALAGAPVVTWEAYDTGYTERYMGLLSENEEGYEASSVLTYVETLPNEENRLLLIHSLMDENVHTCNTTMVINEMINQNKPHEFVLFPKERHGLRQTKAQVYFERKYLSFVVKNL